MRLIAIGFSEMHKIFKSRPCMKKNSNNLKKLKNAYTWADRQKSPVNKRQYVLLME